MNRQEQKTFVRELTRNITRNVLSKSAKWPKTWDGHELRVLLADKFHDSAMISLIAREPRTARAREFRNTCVVCDL